MSELLTQKITEARTLLAQATKEEADREALNLQIEQLNSKVAELAAKRAELTTSSREKRVIAESQLAAAQTLTGGAEVVSLAEKKAANAKKEKPAAAAAATAAPAKEGKARGGKVKKAETEKATPAKSAGKKTKTAAVKAADKPRVASDDKMPPLHERLRLVLGDEDNTIAQAIDKLRARDANWVPESTDLKAYISLALSTHKELFERVKRGIYRLRKSGGSSTASAKPASPAKPAKAAKVKKASAATPTNGAGSGLDELGNNIMDNPFNGTQTQAA